MVDLVYNHTLPLGISEELSPGSLVMFPGSIIFIDGTGEILSRNGLTGKENGGNGDASTFFNMVLANA